MILFIACSKKYVVGPISVAPPTPTNTPIVIFTITPTPTFTATLSPTPSSSSFNSTCSGDSTSISGSGTAVIGPSRSIVPFCDGWVLYGNRSTNQVVAYNVISLVAGPVYNMTAAPGDMAYDPSTNYLYCVLDGATVIARLDLTHGSTTNIPIGAVGNHIGLGPSGQVFVVQGAWPTQTLAILNGPAGTVLTTTAAPDICFPVYDPAINVLFLGVENTSPSSLTSYNYNSGTYALTQITQRLDVGSNGEDIALSADDNHLAFPVGSGNGGYVIYDFDPANINTTYGSWSTGAYPYTAGFSPDSQYLATSNGASVFVYSVATHAVAKTWPAIASLPGIARARFSTGGKYVYMLMGDKTSTSAPASIFWGSFP